MEIMEKIKSLVREAELYRTQRLLDEALERYQKASGLLRDGGDHPENRQNLLQVVTAKINSLKEEIGGSKRPSFPELSARSQDLVKNLFMSAKDMDKKQATLEAATALAKLGQFERAIAEFSELLSCEALRMSAAKNTLRCQCEISPARAVSQLAEWLSADRLPRNELANIRYFLDEYFKKKGIQESLPEVPWLEKNDSPDSMEIETAGFQVEEEEVLDINAIGIELDRGPQKGKTVEIDVSFQSGNVISLMVPRQDDFLTEALAVGKRLDNMQCFSPIAVFRGDGIITSMEQIKSGPKKGNYSVDIKILHTL